MNKPKISFTIDKKGELIVETNINWESPNIIQEMGMLLSYVFFTENEDLIFSIIERSAEAAGKQEEFNQLLSQLENVQGNIMNDNVNNNTQEQNIENITTKKNNDNPIVPAFRAPWFFN